MLLGPQHRAGDAGASCRAASQPCSAGWAAQLATAAAPPLWACGQSGAVHAAQPTLLFILPSQGRARDVFCVQPAAASPWVQGQQLAPQVRARGCKAAERHPDNALNYLQASPSAAGLSERPGRQQLARKWCLAAAGSASRAEAAAAACGCSTCRRLMLCRTCTERRSVQRRRRCGVWMALRRVCRRAQQWQPMPRPLCCLADLISTLAPMPLLPVLGTTYPAVAVAAAPVCCVSAHAAGAERGGWIPGPTAKGALPAPPACAAAAHALRRRAHAMQDAAADAVADAELLVLHAA